jgi:hypothetical protein
MPFNIIALATTRGAQRAPIADVLASTSDRDASKPTLLNGCSWPARTAHQRRLSGGPLSVAPWRNVVGARDPKMVETIDDG